IGMTYDLSGTGKTLARVNYARYYGQVGNGGVAGTINPVSQTRVRFPWADLNRNSVADPGEIALSANGTLVAGNWSPANPAQTTAPPRRAARPSPTTRRRSRCRPRSSRRTFPATTACSTASK